MSTLSKIIKVTLIAGGIYAGTKLFTNGNALKHLTTKIINVKDVRLGLDRIKVKLDILVTNTSKYNLGINLGSVKVKQIQLFNKANNKLIGVADVSINSLNIAASKNYTLTDVEIVVPTLNLISNTNLFTGNIREKVFVKLLVTANGKEYTVDSANFI